MSEERLKEIKDSLETGLTGAKLQALNYAEGVYEDALELYNEVIRLRKQNELYKTSLDESQEVVNDCKTRNEKAIEYIEKNLKTDFDTFHYDILMRNKRCLLNILRGKDK